MSRLETTFRLAMAGIALWFTLEEMGVPIVLYVKRGRFLATWSLSAKMQRAAIDSYRSYQEEAEFHGC